MQSSRENPLKMGDFGNLRNSNYLSNLNNLNSLNNYTINESKNLNELKILTDLDHLDQFKILSNFRNPSPHIIATRPLKKKYGLSGLILSESKPNFTPKMNDNFDENTQNTQNSKNTQTARIASNPFKLAKKEENKENFKFSNFPKRINDEILYFSLEKREPPLTN
jgi:hypothetical protein